MKDAAAQGRNDSRDGDSMKFASAAFLAAALGLALASSSYADTRSSKDKASMEEKAAPSGPKLDEERAESSQGQPAVPNSIGGATVREGANDRAKPAKKSDKRGSSAGSITPAPAADSSAAKTPALTPPAIDGARSISRAD